MFRSRSFAFVVLFAGLGLRLLTQPRASFRLAGRLDIALRLFTFVAACAVLGPRFVAHPGALWLLAIAIAVTGAWLILFPLFVVDVRSRPLTEIRKHAHGAWLLVSVATARLAITAADLTDRTTWPGWLVLAAVAWILAVLLYVLITALIVRRAAARLAPRGGDAGQLDSDGRAGRRRAGRSSFAGRADIATIGNRVGRRDPAGHLRALGAGEPVDPGPALRPNVADGPPSGLGAVHRTWWSAVFPLGMYSAATNAAALPLHLAALSTVLLVVLLECVQRVCARRSGVGAFGGPGHRTRRPDLTSPALSAG